MENVEGILSDIEDTGRRVIDDVREALDQAGYSSEARLLDCSQFGIPQERDRVFIIGARQERFTDPDQLIQDLFDELETSSDCSTPSIRQALANLPRLRRGEGGKVVAGREPGRASEYVRCHNIGGETSLTYNHAAREHPMEKDRTLFDEVMEPGDTGWDIKYRKGRDDLIEYNVGTKENPEFKDKYRMLHWDRPSPTIVAHLQKDSNSFILPDYYQYVQNDLGRADDRRNRGITPREAARLQSFPDSYFFLGPFTSQFRQIGNAVPPVAGKVIASVLVENLLGTAEKPALESEDTTSRAVLTDD
jgi:DNA (cytosine-5)-methyltransferase 1